MKVLLITLPLLLASCGGLLHYSKIQTEHTVDGEAEINTNHELNINMEALETLAKTCRSMKSEARKSKCVSDVTRMFIASVEGIKP
jgi:hypothetical protein